MIDSVAQKYQVGLQNVLPQGCDPRKKIILPSPADTAIPIGNTFVFVDPLIPSGFTVIHFTDKMQHSYKSQASQFIAL